MGGKREERREGRSKEGLGKEVALQRQLEVRGQGGEKRETKTSEKVRLAGKVRPEGRTGLNNPLAALHAADKFV